MIVGIGTDLCDIRRIAATVERRGDRFAQRVLGERELAIWAERRDAHPQRGLSFLATRFAAKEAFSKAIGLGMRMPMTWRACEILKAPGGKPVIALTGELARWFDVRQLTAHVSVTDEHDYAAAFVVVETRAPAPPAP
jgi:holo-[acyl-carrier protein] synthase